MTTRQDERRRVRLWLLALVGAAAWLAHLMLSWALAEMGMLACRYGILIMHGVTAIAALPAAGAAVGAYVSLTRRRGDDTGFLPLLAVLLNTLFLLVIVLKGVSNFVVDPCWV